MRIAIVNDIETIRILLRHAIDKQAGWQLAWEADCGEAAVEQCARDTPDLLLMDLLMPGINGAEATAAIMQRSPCPILVVTAGVDRNAALVFQALAAGALDAVDTPAGMSADAAKNLTAKIGTIAKLIGHRPSRQEAAEPRQQMAEGPLLVAVGSSTGGPAALQVMLSQLPADFSGAVVIAQHLDAEFAAGLAEWLGTVCPLPVAVARAGDRARAGQVLVAGTNDHLVFREDGTLGYTAEPQDQPYRPSVDEFFASAALYWRGPIIGVLLTGMGQDGARGLLALRRLGHMTLAQDEPSCVVYGMPGTAARFGAAVVQMNPDGIGKELGRLAALATGTPKGKRA